MMLRTIRMFPAALLLVVDISIAQTTSIAPATVVAKSFVTGVPTPSATFVTKYTTPTVCEYRLEFVDPADNRRPIWEVNDDMRTGPQRLTLPCVGASPTFAQTPTTDSVQFEDQTVYYWTQRALVYAQKALWLKSPGKLANAGLRPFVLRSATFALACLPEPTDGCSRVWPHEGPRVYLKDGVVSVDTVVHEYGHYAAGYIFGHQDTFSVNGFDVSSCMQRAFQEGVAESFKRLFFHNEWTTTGAGVPSGIAGEADVFNGLCTSDVHDSGYILAEAFEQAVWGMGTGGMTVSWPDSATANAAMASALANGLGTTTDQRLHLVAYAALKFISGSQPAPIPAQVTAIFAAHGLAPLALGDQCTDNTQCVSTRCDIGNGTSKTGMCVPPAASGLNGLLCTADNQCSSSRCLGLHADRSGKWIAGTCAAKLGLGRVCDSSTYCASGYCDAGFNTGNSNQCMPLGGTGAVGNPCSHDSQCGSGLCVGLGRDAQGVAIPGACSAKFALGLKCTANSDCLSTYCDIGDGTSKTSLCMPRGGTGSLGSPCSNDNQCATSVCAGLRQDTFGGWIAGACGAKLGLNFSCSANPECASGYCDHGDGTSKTDKCMPLGPTGKAGAFCSNNNQCVNRVCVALHTDANRSWVVGNCN